jgi:DNA-binding beta-propeller fold protein YncE
MAFGRSGFRASAWALFAIALVALPLVPLGRFGPEGLAPPPSAYPAPNRASPVGPAATPVPAVPAAPHISPDRARPLAAGSIGVPYSTVNVGNSPLGGVYDPADGYLYVSSSASNTVTILNGTASVATVAVSSKVVSSPEGGTYDPTTGMVDIVNVAAGSVTFLDGTNVNGSVAVGHDPYGAAYDGADREVYVPNYASDNVTILKGTQSVGSVALPAGAGPIAVAYDPADSEVYVTDYGLNSVSILSGSTVVGTIPVGREPGDLAYDAADQEIYVTGSISDNVSMIQGGSVVGTLTLGYPVWGATYDPADQLIYITDNYTDNVTGISGSQVVGVLPTEVGPYSVAYDGTNGCIYVMNEYADTVDLITTVLLLGPLGASPAGDPANTTDLGEIITFNASVSGNQSWSYQTGVGAPASLACANPPILSLAQGFVDDSCTPSAAGTFDVTLYVNATDRISLKTSLSFLVYPKFTLGLPVATEGGLKGVAGADLGLTVTWNLTPVGGTGQYSSISWTGFPSGACIGLTAAEPSCVFHKTGTINVYVTATDTNGATAYSAGLPFTLDTLPAATTPKADRTTADIGQIVNFTTKASGGSGTYTYTWLGVPTNCAKTNVPRLSCAPTASGIFQVGVQVTDTFGGTSAPSASVGLAIFTDPVAKAPVATPSTVATNEPFTVVVNVSGGVSTNETIQWNGLPKGCGNYSTVLAGTSLTCRTLYPGTYKVFVLVTDGDGFQTESPTTEITVTGSPPSNTTGGGNGSTLFGLPAADVYAGLGALVALVIVAIAVLALRRRPTETEEEEPPADETEPGEEEPGPYDEGEEAPPDEGVAEADGTYYEDEESAPPDADAPPDSDEGIW